MVTRLDDARITVTLDVESAKKDAARLEEELKAKEEGRRKDREEEERRERPGGGKGKGEGGGKGGGMVGKIGSAILHGGLFSLVQSVFRSLPLGVGLGFSLGFAGAELSERFGPMIEGIVNGLLEKKLGKPMADAIAKASGIFSAPGEALGGAKASLGALEQGFEKAKSLGAARVISGGDISLERFGEEFSMFRKLSKTLADFERAKHRRTLELLGNGIGSFVREGFEDAIGGGKNP